MDEVHANHGADWAAMTPLIREKQAQSAANLRESQSDGPGTLSEEDRAVVETLRARDREVRNHEQAHKRVGGPYASNPTYDYQVGPDGKQYAVGGQVKIDASAVPDDPAATIAKMEVVKAAALAPAEPSAADRQVAAAADATRQRAIADLAALRREQQSVQVDRRA